MVRQKKCGTRSAFAINHGIPSLDFEKPILELQRRLQDLKNHSDEHDLDFDSEVEAMENKIRETRREIYDNLTAWQRVQIARHIARPFALDYIALLHRLD